MNTLLLELAKRNAMAEILKLGNPYGSMLSVLQGSPAYQGQIETAKRGAGLPFVGPEEAAKRGAGYPFDVAMEAFKTQNAEYLKDKEQLGAAGLEPAPNGILIRDPSTGAPIRVPGTKLEFAAISRGLGLPRLGIAPLLKAPDGTIIPPAVFPVGEPVFTPQQTKLGEVDAADVIASRTMAKDAAQSIETNKEARALLDAGLFAGAGSDRVTAIAKIGNALNLTGRNTQETVANTEAYLTTVAQNVGRLIKQFGSGTGLSDNDRNYAAEMAAGRQTLDETSIRKILDINDRAGMNVIKTHNRNVADVPRGATLTPLTVPPPTPYQRVYPEGTVLENPTTGEQQIKRGGKWEPVPK
jgi:hypothetical protein